MKILLVSLLVILMSALLVWLGLRIPPRPFEPVRADGSSAPSRMVPAPDGLPAPVARYLRTLYPAGVPVIDAAIISGRARMRIAGITFPARFRFIHDAGRGYRHYIEATLFGLPVMRVNEWFVNGRARLELPFGVIDGEPKVDQAATLGLWSESIWLPAIYFTDERVRWHAIDDVTAVLAVPGGDHGERFVVRFDPDTGLPHLMESMRFKEPDDERKTLWLNEVVAWGEFGGRRLPGTAALTWFDEGSPWAVFYVEEVVYDVSVADALQARGP